MEINLEKSIFDMMETEISFHALNLGDFPNHNRVFFSLLCYV